MTRSRIHHPSSSTLQAADELYLAAVAQARRPEFYVSCAVPDTVMGRFEMIAIHVFLLLHRLKPETDEGAMLSQALFDAMFADMDRSLREMGTGDLSVGKRIRKIAEGFYGRIAAYDAGLKADGETLAEALRRNLYGTAPAAPGASEPGDVAVVGNPEADMAAYMREQAATLAGQDVTEFLAGRVDFGNPPPGEGRTAKGVDRAPRGA